MKAIHLKCGRDDGVSLNNLRIIDKASRTYRSGQWDISKDEATLLVGGWLYLHPSKALPSEFGGIVTGFEPVVDAALARPSRIVLIVQQRLKGRGQDWRGRDHGMAHSGGLVDAGYEHETETVDV